MRIHEREKRCNEAKNDISTAIYTAQRDHDLTGIEFMQAVQRACDDAISSWLKYELRIERHGNAETPGGLAGDGKKTAATLDFASGLAYYAAEVLSVTDTDDIDKLTDKLYAKLCEEF